MKRVLLIGDSIRLHYQENLKKLLGDEYFVMSPEENCRFSAYVLNSLRFWLAEFENPQIIVFNAGLWDTAILYREDGCFISLDIYLENMKKVLRELKKTGAKIIFATTTPVSDVKKELPGPFPPAHDNKDIREYNEEILKLLKNEPVEIADLYSVMEKDKENLLAQDMIHPNEKGVEVLSSALCEIIKSIKIKDDNKGCFETASACETDEKLIQ